jgi:hypothetical protein
MTDNTQSDTPRRPRGRPRKDYIPRLINVQPDVNAWVLEVHERTQMPINMIVNAILRGYFVQRGKATVPLPPEPDPYHDVMYVPIVPAYGLSE